MPNFSGRHSALVRASQALIARGHAAIDRTRDRAQQSHNLIPKSLDRIVWTRDLMGEHQAAREAVLTFVDIAKGCGLSATQTLALLRDMVQKAQSDAGDTQANGALEQAVMRWGTAACSTKAS
jgi:hypothetical protein